LVKNLSNPKATRQRCTLVGPLCTPLDLIGKDVVIELPEVGNIVAILNSGSYAFTASPLLFLGHKSPPELLVHDNKITQIRQSKKLSDFN
jgi:diaminopimelate decarboxylase